MKLKRSLLSLAVLASAVMVAGVQGTQQGAVIKNAHKFYNDFNTIEEAKAAAADLNLQIAAEGDVLVKNDGTLPLTGLEKISIFGGMQNSLVGGTETVVSGFKKAGFSVNATLDNYYKLHGGKIGAEDYTFNPQVQNSISIYNDVAVVLFARAGGEGADTATVTNEAEIPGKHANEVTGKKHYLEFTDSELALLDFVKVHSKKVAVLINTSNPMELGDLQDDDRINAVLTIGRPGENGIEAAANIFKGAINPSGRLTDEWERDFTLDPTWQNFGDNSQMKQENLYYYADGTPTGTSGSSLGGGTGYHGIDYEESIYLGYKYYETRYHEYYKTDAAKAQAWYDNSVIYPFGYGLSFTTFSFKIKGLYKDADLKKELTTTSGAEFASGEAEAQVKKLYVPVVVKNTGSVTGKQTVQVYVTAPYTKNGVEKSYVNLVGFAKSDSLRPGQSQTVVVEFNVQDMASYDYSDANKNGNKGYELDPGEYIVRAMDSSHVDESLDVADLTDAYDQVKFTITGTAPINLKLDDFSGNKVENLFSAENGDNDAIRENVNQDGSKMSQMTRGDMSSEVIASFPAAPTKADRTMKKEFTDKVVKYELFDADAPECQAMDLTEDWAAEVSIPDVWTQATTAYGPKQAPIQFKDMGGIALDDAKWDTFVNQLTWDQLKGILAAGGHTTVAIDSIGKGAGKDENGPNGLNGTYTFADETVVASTFNVDLARQQGEIIGDLGVFSGCTGWYGPGMNTHRSHFAGRNNEYFSQDGILGGYMAANVVGGAQNRGLIVYTKHFLLNDQETNRNGECCFTWVNEQAFREIYLKPFQMAIQEGGTQSLMTAFARVGAVPAFSSYNLQTKLVRDELGWTGYYVTDAWAGGSKCTSMDLLIRGGGDLPDGTPNKADVMTEFKDGKAVTVSTDRKVSGEWDATLRGGKGGVKVGTTNKVESAAQYYFVRKSATRVLYNTANSILAKNGLDLSVYTGKNLAKCVQGSAVNGLSVAADKDIIGDEIVTYAIAKGKLPKGLTLNEDGTITGTPVEAGVFDFTIALVVDSVFKTTADYSLTVDSAFYLQGTDLSKVKEGDEINTYITSDNVTTENFTSVSYAVEDGSLPEGLTLGTDGLISGTAKAGEYDVNVVVTVTNTIPSRWSHKTVTSKFYYSFHISVAANGTDPVEEDDDLGKAIAELKAEVEALKKAGSDVAALEARIKALEDASKQTPAAKDYSSDIAALKAEIEELKTNAGTEKKGGCGGSVIAAASTVGALGLLAAGLILKKKREDK